jgi:hypothetical protein
MLIQQADPAFAVHERDEILTEQPYPHWLAIGDKLAFEQSRHPEAAHQLPHRRVRPNAAKQFVIVMREHLTHPLC